MSSHEPSSLSIARDEGRALDESDPKALAADAQRTGKRLILAGSAITVVGVILYCAVCFAGGMDAGLGEILFENAVPFARGALVVLGIGTLVWLIGSYTYLKSALESDPAEPSPPV
jgi:hypothetical protein